MLGATALVGDDALNGAAASPMMVVAAMGVFAVIGDQKKRCLARLGSNQHSTPLSTQKMRVCRCSKSISVMHTERKRENEEVVFSPQLLYQEE